MRLIDADELIYEDIKCVDGNTYMVVHAPQIDNAPTCKQHEQIEILNKYLSQEIQKGNSWLEKNRNRPCFMVSEMEGRVKTLTEIKNKLKELIVQSIK